MKTPVAMLHKLKLLFFPRSLSSLSLEVGTGGGKREIESMLDMLPY